MNIEQFENREQTETYEQEFSWDNDVKNSDRAAEIVEQELSRLDWPDDQAHRFALATQEAVMNAIVHGNLRVSREDGEGEYSERIKAAQESNGTKQVSVRFRFTKDEATAQIKDEGEYVPDAIVDPTQADRLLKESGRGMMIIFNAVDDVSFSPGEITIRKRRKDNEDGIQ